MCRRGTERVRFYFVSKNRAGLDLIAHALIGGRPKVGGAKQAEVFLVKIARRSRRQRQVEAGTVVAVTTIELSTERRLFS